MKRCACLCLLLTGCAGTWRENLEKALAVGQAAHHAAARALPVACEPIRTRCVDPTQPCELERLKACEAVARGLAMAGRAALLIHEALPHLPRDSQ